MGLNFKQTSRKPNPKSQPRNTKRYKEFEGRHIPKRKMLGNHFVGDWNNYPRVNMESWLSKQVDRPIDKVLSDFTKEFKKTYKGNQSPEEFLFGYIHRRKNEDSWRWIKFYVSDSGILCRYSKYNTNAISYKTRNRRRETPKSHIEYNRRVLKDIKMRWNDYGPRYLGKVWATAKGYTKIMNVWLVDKNKFTNRSTLFGLGVQRNKRTHLEQFTQASVAGYGSVLSIAVEQPYLGDTISETKHYLFVVKLSDLQ